MFKRRKRSKFPELNMVATADISFMLLIFFLVTTSMDTDRGLQRKLPPMDTNDKQVEQLVETGETLTLSLTADGQLLADGQAISTADVCPRTKDFISSRGERHLIILEVDPEADYGLYFSVQNSLKDAYSAVRDSISLTRFRKHYKHLDSDDAAEVQQEYPYQVSEK